MKIIINNSSMVPIYEQIMEQIKAQIISGELKENDILPSVRTMAKELKISALTVKKAYDNLEAEGMTVTVHGKGTYVAASNTQLMEEERRKEVEEDLEAAIQKGVKKSYGEFQLDCSLNIEKGRITGLVGENGAGKSTVFKAVLGLISYDGGEIKILGKTPQELNEKEKEQMGVVLAEAGFSGYLKGKDVKAVLAKLYPKFEEEKFLQMCERYQIPLDKFLKEYSTGMKAKLNLIIALTHQADFLMLDEPTAGLDVGAREGMLDILRTYMEEEPERSILISSHISSDLEHLCDDIYVIHKGKIVLHEEMDRILEKYAMLKVSEEQYQALDKNYILKERKENFGIACLTNEKQYYTENYPEIVVESGSLDQVILMLTGGGM